MVFVMFSWHCISVVENYHSHHHNIRSGRPKMCPRYIDVITDINKYEMAWMDLWVTVENILATRNQTVVSKDVPNSNERQRGHDHEQATRLGPGSTGS